MSDTKWVQHISGQGKKYRVELDGHTWRVRNAPGQYDFLLPKSEYRLCDPPERWEVVPLNNRLRLNKNARSFCIPDLFENERFAIKDGALVLERKVEG